jgi:hypothetical protein
MSSKIIAGTTSGTALNMSADTSGILEIQTGSTPTTAITVDGSQNVTLNNVIPSGSTVPANGMFLPTTNSVGFSTASTERMRIDSSGNLLVGTTSSLGKLTVRQTGATGDCAGFRNGNDGGSGITFYNTAGTAVGYIAWTASVTSYVSTSDYRLKDNVEPMTGALAKVAKLKPVTYKWKENGSNGQGFIAHELAEICPDAVTGKKDAVNEDGSIKAQGIDTSFLVATLTAAIQELNAKVDAQAAEIIALQTKVTALEAK